MFTTIKFITLALLLSNSFTPPSDTELILENQKIIADNQQQQLDKMESAIDMIKDELESEKAKRDASEITDLEGQKDYALPYQDYESDTPVEPNYYEGVDQYYTDWSILHEDCSTIKYSLRSIDASLIKSNHNQDILLICITSFFGLISGLMIFKEIFK